MYLPGLLARCEAVIANLRRSRQSLNVERKPSIRKEVLGTLRGKSVMSGTQKAKRRKCAWKHKFVCLGHVGQEKVPLREKEKDELSVAGLGEKEVEFHDLEALAEEF